MKILLIDNYDSFTYNLADYLSRCGADLTVIRNDAFALDLVLNDAYKGVVLSPGPSIPENSGLLMPFIDRYVGKIPMLGVCLGFQALGLHFGAELVKAPEPVHGKVSAITCVEHTMYEGIAKRHQVTRYHSLCLRNMPNCLGITACTLDGLPMAFAHSDLPVWAVQYHPESILTEFGLRFIHNWMLYAKDWKESHKRADFLF